MSAVWNKNRDYRSVKAFQVLSGISTRAFMMSEKTASNEVVAAVWFT